MVSVAKPGTKVPEFRLSAASLALSLRVVKVRSAPRPIPPVLVATGR